MDRELQAIAGVVGVVLVVAIFGFVAKMGGFGAPDSADALTGMVVDAPGSAAPDECDCEPGQPVCAAVGNRLQTLPSACHAGCLADRIVYPARCAAIPVIVSS